jgi:hypothetical protein
MSSPSAMERQRTDVTAGWYVYGIVEPDVEVLPEARGIGDPPAAVEVVRGGGVAALVSEIILDRPIGRPDDLLAHQRLLDAVVVDAAVLPVRFGAVLTSRDAVAQELLGENEEAFAAALKAMAGRVQYVVRARYIEAALMRAVLEANPAAAKLAESIRDKPAEATRDVRIQLGEIVNNLVEAIRNTDTDRILNALEPVSEATAVRPPPHEMDAAHVALLVNTSRGGDLEQALNRIARDWAKLATVRLLGPMAPYDFVVTTKSEG